MRQASREGPASQPLARAITSALVDLVGSKGALWKRAALLVRNHIEWVGG